MCFKFLIKISKRVVRQKSIFTEPIPSVPVVYMRNHANDFGPSAMQFAIKNRPFKCWAISAMTDVKTAPNQIMKTIFPNARGLKWILARPLSYLMAPAMVAMFKAAGVIPVWRDQRLKMTYHLTFETLKSGGDVVVFPKCIVPREDNEFVDTFQKGAFKLFSLAKIFNAELPPVIPVYCCKKLKTVVFGKPLYFDTTLTPFEAENKLADEVALEIKRLALTLPKHKVTHYALHPKNIERIRKYFLPGEDKIYEALRDYQNAQKAKREAEKHAREAEKLKKV